MIMYSIDNVPDQVWKLPCVLCCAPRLYPRYPCYLSHRYFDFRWLRRWPINSSWLPRLPVFFSCLLSPMYLWNRRLTKKMQVVFLHTPTYLYNIWLYIYIYIYICIYIYISLYNPLITGTAPRRWRWLPKADKSKGSWSWEALYGSFKRETLTADGTARFPWDFAADIKSKHLIFSFGGLFSRWALKTWQGDIQCVICLICSISPSFCNV